MVRLDWVGRVKAEMGSNDTLRSRKWRTRGLPAEIRVVRTWGVFLGVFLMLMPFASGFFEPTHGSLATDSWMVLSGALLVIPWSRVRTKQVREPRSFRAHHWSGPVTWGSRPRLRAFAASRLPCLVPQLRPRLRAAAASQPLRLPRALIAHYP